MIASLRQPLHIDQRPPALGRSPGRASRTLETRALALATAIFGFCAFMPYAAMAVGSHTAIQTGNVLATVMALPALLIVWRNRPLWIYPALIAPLVLSMVAVGMTGGDISLSFKSLLLWALSALTLVVVQVFGPGFFLHLLTGVAVAAICHVIVGFWQLVAFQQGYFPLDWFYVNASFLSVQENIEIIVRYIQRPFGLFPEPSAMSASLAPFVLLWMAMLGGLVKLRQQPSRLQSILFTTAAVGSLGLMIISRSGHTAMTLAAGLALAAVWFKRSRATRGNVIAILLTLGVVIPMIIYFAADALDDRMGGSQMGNSSWAERSSSMLIGVKLLGRGGVLAGLFGLGTGMMSPLMQKLYHLEAVWSITLTYLYETGAVGAFAFFFVARAILRTWRASRFDLVFAAILFVWLVGVTITTSYVQLLPIWVCLGMLTIWNTIIEPAATPTPALPRQARASAPTEAPHAHAGLRAPGARRWSQRDEDALPEPTPEPAAPRSRRWRDA
jgi:hypothetical protein